ncbi:serine hydrolase domain-containing protein [Paraburkholderia sp. 22099]|jgi:CubicO group peptidase (beta-lactamase class C family)|uniref:serine hydrolase domain-containing protein n=1 Tax=Paraburkholderia TaxID=1822464 RepID=UPI0009F34372|nr:serine hydrolase domain-containing protein [Paraburkholderia terricola]AXE95379.1 serine hydrolase [Paraburkholderia terricola]MDR6446992.1 CubicO group peptidase (beta-lactamase class C family) [Paraburkholderia terricola]MDR6492606.1 CubicO group peptidase (beta-lactamase class C family) [Paraburkholderia terricola]ORC52107.1 serine hydrolase [Burkholderia sp. A27]
MRRAGFSAARLTALTNAMQGYVQRGEVAGVVSMVWRRGETGYFEPLGWRDETSQLPMERDTLFRIASMTKPVTSAAILMLIEEDRLALDTPLSTWLPELAAPRVLRDPTGPLDETDPASAPLTVLDLLTHRAGFAYHFTAEGPLAEAYAAAFNGLEAGAGNNAWLAHIARLPLMFQPGLRWHYGIATDVLGVLIERVSSMSLGEFFRTRIFEPLGMRDTGFSVPDAQLARLATAYGVQPGTGRRVVEDHPSSSRWANPDRFQSGGGGLVSTAQDYLQFAQLLLGRGRVGTTRLLSHRSVDLMRSNFLTRDQRRVPAFGHVLWAGQGFGLGLSIVDDPAQQLPHGYRSMGSFGWPGAFGTSWFADPVEELIGLMLIQRRAVEPFPMAVDFERRVYDAIDD